MYFSKRGLVSVIKDHMNQINQVHLSPFENEKIKWDLNTSFTWLDLNKMNMLPGVFIFSQHLLFVTYLGRHYYITPGVVSSLQSKKQFPEAQTGCGLCLRQHAAVVLCRRSVKAPKMVSLPQ